MSGTHWCGEQQASPQGPQLDWLAWQGRKSRALYTANDTGVTVRVSVRPQCMVWACILLCNETLSRGGGNWPRGKRAFISLWLIKARICICGALRQHGL